RVAARRCVERRVDDDVAPLGLVGVRGLIAKISDDRVHAALRDRLGFGRIAHERRDLVAAAKKTFEGCGSDVSSSAGKKDVHDGGAILIESPQLIMGDLTNRSFCTVRECTRAKRSMYSTRIASTSSR